MTEVSGVLLRANPTAPCACMEVVSSNGFTGHAVAQLTKVHHAAAPPGGALAAPTVGACIFLMDHASAVGSSTVIIQIIAALVLVVAVARGIMIRPSQLMLR